MGDRVQVDFPTVFLRAQRKFEQWRERRRSRVPIPEELWREAAELACAHGVNRTAAVLRARQRTSTTIGVV